MKAPIIMHGNWVDNYDDPTHPIPSVSALDVQGILKPGGSDMTIVVASPLQADERSQQRLLSKIELYLKYLTSAEYEKQCGTPIPSNTSIIVRIHQDSAAEIFELLERCRSWVFKNHATLKVEPMEVVQ